MPPKGEPLTEEEINMLKQWIEEGAKENPSDTFEKPKVENVDLQPVAGDKKESIIDLLSKRLNSPSKPQIQAAQKSGALVSLLSTKHSLLRAEFSSGPNLIKDDAIGALTGIKNNISHLDLSRTSVTDNVLSEVKKFNILKKQSLKDTAIVSVDYSGTQKFIKKLLTKNKLNVIKISGKNKNSIYYYDDYSIYKNKKI